MSSIRHIILRQITDNLKVKGYIIQEQQKKNGKTKLTIRYVIGDKQTNRVQTIKTIRKYNITADKLINILKDHFKVISDKTSVCNTSEFKIIDNLNKITTIIQST